MTDPDPISEPSEPSEPANKQGPAQSVAAETSPTHKVNRLRKRTALIALEACAAGFMLMLIVSAAVIIRLMSAPLDISFARDYIEEALKSPQRGLYATMDSVVLHWPDLQGPLLLGLRGGKIMNAQGLEVISVEEVSLALSKRHLLIGRISPEALILRRPALRVVRTESGRFDMGLNLDTQGSEGADVPQEQAGFVQRILDVIARPGAEDDGSPLGALEALRIEEARLTYRNARTGADLEFPKADLSFESREGGLGMMFYIEMPMEDGTLSDGTSISSLTLEGLLGWESRELVSELTLHKLRPRIFAGALPELTPLAEIDVALDGKIAVLWNADFTPREAALALDAKEGSISIPDYAPDPVVFQDLSVQGNYDAVRKIIKLEHAQITARDVKLAAKGELGVGADEFSGPLQLSIDTLEQARMKDIWPASLVGDNSEEWIVHKLSEGVFRNLYAHANLRAVKREDGWHFGAEDVRAGFDFEDMTVDYRPPMLPVTQAKGSGLFDLDLESLSVQVESAQVAGLQVDQADLAFNDIIKEGAGQASISLALQGPLSDGIGYLMKEPIGLVPPFDVAGVKGMADVQVQINFPTNDIDVEDVKVEATGSVSDALLPGLVSGLDLTGGPFEIAVSGNSFKAKGKGELAGRPVDAHYDVFLNSQGQSYKSRARASLVADPNLRTHFGADLAEFIEGSAPVSVTYTEFHEGRSEAEIRANLKPARVFYEPFGYEKPVDAEGEASARIVLQDETLRSVEDLEVSGPGLKISGATLRFTGAGKETTMTAAQIPQLVVGETVARFDLKTDAAGAHEIAITGSVFDLRPLMERNDDEASDQGQAPMKIAINVDRLRAGETEVVEQGRIVADLDAQGRFNALELDGIAGDGDIMLRFRPDESGRRSFSLSAGDAGAALRAFGLYENVRGGTLLIRGEPVRGDQDRNLVGVAEMTNFRVVRAPTLARLLGALSLPGLMELLSNDGVAFEKLEAKYDWLFRPQGSLLVLQDGRTSGSSVGFTFDGVFDHAQSELDVSGTIVPLSTVNSVIGNIPLIGEILTGGSGGVFAATYKIEGHADDPAVSVNPLSVLAPGILRRILFE